MFDNMSPKEIDEVMRNLHFGDKIQYRLGGFLNWVSTTICRKTQKIFETRVILFGCIHFVFVSADVRIFHHDGNKWREIIWGRPITHIKVVG